MSYHNYRPLLHLILGMTCQDALPPVTSLAGRPGCPWIGSEECRAACLYLCLHGLRQGQWFEEEVDGEEVVWTDTRLGALAGTG